MKTALIYSEEWRRFDYGPEHPLRMERLGLTWSLMEAYGLTALPRAKVLAPEIADVGAITRFHAREYVDILRAVSAGDWVPHAARWLGPATIPSSRLWSPPLRAVGSLLAARLVADGRLPRLPLAGGSPACRTALLLCTQRRGAAILALRHAGQVAYVDIDAHHCDGVQFAFYGYPTC